MNDTDYFNMVKSLRQVDHVDLIDNELVVANLLAGVATELRELNKNIVDLRNAVIMLRGI